MYLLPELLPSMVLTQIFRFARQFDSSSPATPGAATGVPVPPPVLPIPPPKSPKERLILTQHRVKFMQAAYGITSLDLLNSPKSKSQTNTALDEAVKN